jgi:hypothetical protein
MPPQAGSIATKELRFLYLLFLLYSSCLSCFNAEYTKPEPFNEGDSWLEQSSSLQNLLRAGQLKILRKPQSSKIPSRDQIEIAWEATMKWIVGSILRMVQTDSKHIAQRKACLTNLFSIFFFSKSSNIMLIKDSLSQCHVVNSNQQYPTRILRIITEFDVDPFSFVHAKRSARFGTESEIAEKQC